MFKKKADQKTGDRVSAVGMYLSEVVVAIHNMDNLFGEGAKQRFYDSVAELVSENLKETGKEIGYEASTALIMLHIMVGEAMLSQRHLEIFLPRLLAYYRGEGQVIPHEGNFRIQGI